ncbi:MAG: hypothetical protein PSV22_13220 [Pseudolabrys sp.]|nr:hypothetical protein [Pseudolabrys sp.]
MMRSIATTGLRAARGERRSTRKYFVRIFLSAQLILTAAALAGCGTQTFSEVRPSLNASKAPRPRPVSTVAARPAVKRQLAPTFNDGDTSQASPNQASNAAAATIPDKDETTAAIRSDVSVGSAPRADPRTVRAMNCRDLMLKEHPTVRFGGNGTAAAQREYFDSCMRHVAASP